MKDNQLQGKGVGLVSTSRLPVFSGCMAPVSEEPASAAKIYLRSGGHVEPRLVRREERTAWSS